MKKKYFIGTISDKKLKKKVRKKMPPIGAKHKTSKDYNRKNKYKNKPEE
jgi:hypothetical protein